MSKNTIFEDKFAIENLPPEELLPEFIYELPELQYPSKLNCANPLLAENIAAGRGDKLAVIGEHQQWSYSELDKISNRIAHVLVEDMGLVPGNRVLLFSPNNPMLTACWFAVMKASGIAVTVMPLLKAGELSVIIEKAQVSLALCDTRLSGELEPLLDEQNGLENLMLFDSVDNTAELNTVIQQKPETFDIADTASDDLALIAFTSGTTGQPKGCMHFHRDVISMAVCFSKQVLQPDENDIFIGSPPLAFTFGLGALLVFPLYVGAAVVLTEKGTPKDLAMSIERYKATISVTSPTGYRKILSSLIDEQDLSSLKKAVSAGEPLPASVAEEWHQKTQIKLVDGIGATEMIHIFISAAGDDIRFGYTGKVIPGYQACILDNNHTPVGPGEEGLLAVKGPTGCRYLADERQKKYVVNGWNITGDVYSMNEDGYFRFISRADDMIISGGYNISAVEVETALLKHDAVDEVAVVGAPDQERGHIVKAFIILKGTYSPDDTLVKELKDFVKSEIAPYKYPREIEFIDALPKTATGKVQRSQLRSTT